MYSFLSQMWCSYMIEHPYVINPEKQKQLNEILIKEECLVETFSPEQTTLFFQYHDSISHYHMIEEQDAFINGMLFASAFFTDIIKSIGTKEFPGT